jgi:hypothetical protein
MVFAINPPLDGTKSFAEFKKRAIAINGTTTTSLTTTTNVEPTTSPVPNSYYSSPVDHKITGEFGAGYPSTIF